MSEPPHATGAAPFEPDRFTSTIPYYLRFRLEYPAELLQRVLGEFGLGAGARVLDLGCGPGFLANGFATLGCTALGIDPSPQMVEAAVQAAARASSSAAFRVGSSYDLDTMPERFDVAVMGRSFHWTDRPQTLQSLDRMVAADGGVVVFYDWRMRCAENAFENVLNRMRERFSANATRLKQKKANAVKPDESVLLDSAFSRVVRIGLVERRPLTADQIVGRAFSLSATSPAALRERLPAFETELRDRLAELQPDGQFVELVEFVALIGRRRSQIG
jgi:SAM-dependent methyltransferase